MMNGRPVLEQRVIRSLIYFIQSRQFGLILECRCYIQKLQLPKHTGFYIVDNTVNRFLFENGSTESQNKRRYTQGFSAVIINTLNKLTSFALYLKMVVGTLQRCLSTYHLFTPNPFRIYLGLATVSLFPTERCSFTENYNTYISLLSINRLLSAEQQHRVKLI